MSCIRFNTPAQRAQMELLRHTGQRNDDPVAQFLSPPVSESKINRLVTMAKSSNPKIRESVALSYHAPESVYWDLARDPNQGVRECLARNPQTSCDILRVLATDPSERVRAFVAVNYSVPVDAMEILSEDPSDLVRALVGWKDSLREQEWESVS